MNDNVIHIDPLSCSSLRVELAARGNSLGTATGFVVQRDSNQFLITNWHVLSGRSPETGQPLSDAGALPDEIRIVHHHSEQLGRWAIVSQQLRDEHGDVLWIEHSDGPNVDLAALSLELDDSIKVYPLDLGLADHDVVLQPAMSVSIIGYPYGLATGAAFPIWKTGHIASDPDLDYDGRPAFLIDATTRGGMSGSPVIYRTTGGYPSKSGAITFSGLTTAFLGVYSGRIHPDAEVGRVWRPKLIEELFEDTNGA